MAGPRREAKLSSPLLILVFQSRMNLRARSLLTVEPSSINITTTTMNFWGPEIKIRDFWTKVLKTKIIKMKTKIKITKNYLIRILYKTPQIKITNCY